MLTPGFGGPNGPAFPSHTLLLHALGPHPDLKSSSLDCCCSLSGDVARPLATAVISVVRTVARRTWLTYAKKGGQNKNMFVSALWPVNNYVRHVIGDAGGNGLN